MSNVTKTIYTVLALMTTAVVVLVLGMAAIAWSGLKDQRANTDVAVVLGTTVYSNGLPSAKLMSRLDKAAELYKQGLFPTIIVSGSIGPKGYNEPDTMKSYLVQQGIPAGCIVVDRVGFNTYCTARNTARYMRAHDLRSVTVVTQYFHLPRARLALRRFGVMEIYSAHASIFERRDLYYLAREVAGYVVYTLRPYPA